MDANYRRVPNVVLLREIELAMATMLALRGTANPPTPTPQVGRYLLQLRRVLPADGELAVQPGDKVEPSTVVGTCTLSPQRSAIDMASMLGITPERVADSLVAAPGERCAEGALIATHRRLLGLRTRSVLAPFTGHISGFSSRSGLAWFEGESQEIALPAGLYGSVIDVVPPREAVIEAEAVVVRGMYAVGGEASGNLTTVLSQTTETEERLILVSREPATVDVMRRATQLQAAGVVAPSAARKDMAALGMDPLARPSMHTWKGPPLFLTEGFGEQTMTDTLWELLTAQPVAWATVIARPDLHVFLLVLPMRSLAPKDAWTRFGPGSRLKSAGMSVEPGEARLDAFLPFPLAVPSGLRLPAAETIDAEERRARVPITELEWLM